MHPPQLDVETLLFIAQSNVRPQRPNPIDKKGCFKCGAQDNWHRECPHDEKQPHFKPIPRFCEECTVSHLPIQCPKNPANGTQAQQDKGKAPLNMIQIIPSRIEDKMVVPIHAFTRAQAKENPKLQPKELEQVANKEKKA